MYCALVKPRKHQVLHNVSVLDRFNTWVELVYDIGRGNDETYFSQCREKLFAKSYSLVDNQRPLAWKRPVMNVRKKVVFLVVDDNITYALQNPNFVERDLGKWMILICLHPSDFCTLDLSLPKYKNLSVILNVKMDRKSFITMFLNYLHTRRHMNTSLCQIHDAIGPGIDVRGARLYSSIY
jgi:hypothetical protein